MDKRYEWYGTFADGETVEEAETEAKDKADEAQNAVEEGNKQDAHDRITELEARIVALEESMKNQQDKSFAPADHNHDHQMPPGYNVLVDALKDLEEKEHAPEKLPFWRRPIIGG